MARPLDARQKEELVAVLDELYRAGGYETQAQWAREAGFPSANLSKALNRANLVGVDGYNLLKLIQAAAKRAAAAPAAVALERARDGQPPSTWGPRIDRRLEELEATVAELPTADDLGRAVATLQAAIDRLASRDSREAQPARRARKSAGS